MKKSGRIKGRYIVYRVFRNSYQKRVIKINLTEKQAQKLVKSYKSTENSMVVYDIQK